MILEPINEIEALDASGRWRSAGDDPCFRIQLPFVRTKRHFVFMLACDEAEMEPQLFVNFGIGFKERQSFNPRAAHRHCIIVDVGALGTVRALRLDPTNRPAEFTCRAEAFRTREEAEAVAEEWCRQSRTLRSRYARLSRLIFSGTPLGFSRSNKLANHLESLHHLAAIETAELNFEDGETPFLSLVVPVYNAPERYLDELIRSFRRQAAGFVELVLSDDASPSSATRQWLDRHESEPNVRIVRNPQNRGIALTTNAGIEATRGKWIGLLDLEPVRQVA